MVNIRHPTMSFGRCTQVCWGRVVLPLDHPPLLKMNKSPTDFGATFLDITTTVDCLSLTWKIQERIVKMGYTCRRNY